MLPFIFKYENMLHKYNLIQIWDNIGLQFLPYIWKNSIFVWLYNIYTWLQETNITVRLIKSDKCYIKQNIQTSVERSQKLDKHYTK